MVEKVYVRERVYTFKRELLTANVTWNIASRAFYTLSFRRKRQSTYLNMCMTIVEWMQNEVSMYV